MNKNKCNKNHPLSFCVNSGGGGVVLCIFVSLQGATQAMKVENGEVLVEQIL